MRSNVYSVRNEAREERKRQALAAGLVVDRFPGVSSIVVTMNYKSGGFSPVLRTLNFYPGSNAFFRISCLGEGCDDGVLDLTNPIDRLIKARQKSVKGKLNCDNTDAAILHPIVDYEVAVTYS
jgi:hypothetical protein